MDILYFSLLICLILVSIFAENVQTKKITLTILIVLFSLAGIIQLSKFGLSRGLAGVLGMFLPASIAGYFLNKISKK